MTKTEMNQIARAMEDTLISPNELDSNLESANIVDVLGNLSRAIHALSTSNTDSAAELSKAIREGSLNIASAIGELAQAISSQKDRQ